MIKMCDATSLNSYDNVANLETLGANRTLSNRKRVLSSHLIQIVGVKTVNDDTVC